MEVINLNIDNNPAAFAQLAIAPAGGVPLQGINFLLDIIGFHIPAECKCLIKAGLADYEDFHYLTKKDIRDMAEELSKWTQAQGHITFSLSRIKCLMGLMHWIQDCFHAGDDPDSVTFDEEALAKKAQSRALVHKSDIDLVDTNSKMADPGKIQGWA